MSKRITYIIIFLLMAAATALTQQQHRHSTDPPVQMTKATPGNMKIAADDKKFAMKAADASMAEVQLGQLALTQAGSEEVKRFARRMIDDHGKTNAELTQLAQNKGITLPVMAAMGAVDMTNDSATTPTGQHVTGAVGQQKSGVEQRNDRAGLTPVTSDSSKAMKSNTDHQKRMDKMARLTGADFDREYMKHQVNDHDKAVALFEKQSRSGKDAELKAFAGRTLPTLKEHQQMAKDINSRVGGKINASAKMEK
jgi:putative membrane protein